MTRNVSDTTKRIRAINQVERIKAKQTETIHAFGARLLDIEAKHKAKVKALDADLETARADYKQITGEDCPL